MQIHTSRSRSLRQAPSLFDIIHSGDIDISPDLGRRILDEADFEGQRQTDRRFVLTHLENINRGLWIRSPIAFCTIGERLYLVNGRHRISALVESKKVLEFSVVLHECESMDEVCSIYARYDSVQRQRTTNQIANAYNLSSRMDVSKQVSEAVFRATSLLMNGLRPVYYGDPSSLEARVKLGLNDLRFDMALNYAQEAQIYESFLDEAKTHRWKKLLLSSNIFAVALVTLKYQPERAADFWREVAVDSGLLRGDPRKALVEFINVNGIKNNPMNAGLAWNAFYRGKNLTFVKCRATTPVKILGTPFGGQV